MEDELSKPKKRTCTTNLNKRITKYLAKQASSSASPYILLPLNQFISKKKRRFLKFGQRGFSNQTIGSVSISESAYVETTTSQ
jgi:hypothetical protein